MFITVTMTGMDQEMMQKSISVKTLKDSQKNMVVLGFIMLVVIFLFLFLGGLLHLFASSENLSVTGDHLFPELALHHMPPFISIIFIIALISALFPSSDGAITALTASFCIDILGINRNEKLDEATKKKNPPAGSPGFHCCLPCFCPDIQMDFQRQYDWYYSQSGHIHIWPLLGLFSFSILTRRSLRGKWVPLVCILSPILCFFLDKYQQ